MKRCMLAAGVTVILLGGCTMSADREALPPLVTTGSLPPAATAIAAVAQPTSTVTTTTVAPTSTTSTSVPTTSSTTVPAVTTTAFAPTTAVTTTAGLVDGVRATIGGRELGFGAACEQGQNLVLDGVTWAFAGNSFRFDGDSDVRSEAVLIGDGFAMPMLVASVTSGVYTYVGTPVANSVSSATVVVDFGALSSC